LDQISATTLELERLGFMHAKTAEAQIAAIEQQTIQELALLELRRQLPADADEGLADAEFELLVKAVKEGKEIQIAAIEAVEAKKDQAAKDSVEREKTAAKKAIEAAMKVAKKKREDLRKIVSANREALREIRKDWGAFGVQSAEDFKNPILQMILELADQFGLVIKGTADLFGTDLAEKMEGPLNQLAGYFEETPAFALAALEKIIAGAEEQFKAMEGINLLAMDETGAPIYTDEQMEDMRLMIDNVNQYALAEAQAAVEMERFTEFLDRQTQRTREATIADLEHQMVLEQYHDVYQQRIADARELEIAELDAERAMQQFIAAGEDSNVVWRGMRMGAANFMKSAQSMEDALANLTEGALREFTSGLTTAITAWADGSKTAEEAFDDFAVAFAIAVGQMIVQMLVMAAVVAALRLLGVPIPASMMPVEAAEGAVFQGGLGTPVPLAMGGVVPGGLGRALPLHGYANGGPIVAGPHLALIGEGKHNEAVVPLPDGRSIPVDMRGGGAEVNISITTVDARGVDELLVDRQETLRAIIRQAMTEDRSFRSSMRG